MSYAIKLGVWTLLGLAVLIFAPKILEKFDSGSSFSFDFKDSNVAGVKISPPKDNTPELASRIEEVLEGEDGYFAVVVEELGRQPGDSKGVYYGLHSDEVFPAGSLYKLFLLSAALKEVREGRLGEEELLSGSQKALSEQLGFEEFGYEDFKADVVYFKLPTVLSRIATISDNYASLMLAEKIGWEAVRAQAKELGASSTIIQAPISTTASDIARYFKALYQGEVVSPQDSQKIIELLSDSKLNSRIPAKLPKGIKIAHKTGELSRVRHDGGIVFLEGRPYLIVMLSKDLRGEDSGVEVLATISKVVYEYMSNLPSRP